MHDQIDRSRLIFLAIVCLPLLALASWAQLSFADAPPAQQIADSNLSDEQQKAQGLALSSPALLAYGLSARSEVFHVIPLSHFRPKQQELCRDANCYQVDIYDYDNRSTSTVIVDVASERVLDQWQLADSYPVYSDAAAQRATKLLLESEELTAALGRPVIEGELAFMQGQHATVDQCDEASEFCLTTVFVVDSGMIWATVDMQQDEVASIWWTARPSDGAEAAKRDWEQTSAFAPSVTCGDTFTHTEGGWTINYEVSVGDGLSAYDISYQGEQVIDSIKLVEWYVDYTVQNESAAPDGFVDFVTCETQSGGGRIRAFGNPQTLPMVEMSQTVGFEIVQDFRQTFWGFTCRYRYDQRYQFFFDGSFRVVSGAYGRGCGDQELAEAIYRAVTRIDLTSDSNGEYFEQWDGSQWVEQTTEAWFGRETPQTEWHGFPTDANGNAFRTSSAANGYLIEPGNGQFNDGGTGDDAWVYLTRFKPSEGAADLGKIGECCSSTYEQGPLDFVNDELTSGWNSVIWYVTNQATVTDFGAGLPVGQRPADMPYCWTDRGPGNVPTTEYPCFAGPKFHPIAPTVATAVMLGGGSSAETTTLILLLLGLFTLLLTATWHLRKRSQRHA